MALLILHHPNFDTPLRETTLKKIAIMRRRSNFRVGSSIAPTPAFIAFAAAKGYAISAKAPEARGDLWEINISVLTDFNIRQHDIVIDKNRKLNNGKEIKVLATNDILAFLDLPISADYYACWYFKADLELIAKG